MGYRTYALISLDIPRSFTQPLLRFRVDIEAPEWSGDSPAEFLGIGFRCAHRGARPRGQSEDLGAGVLSSLAILA